MLRDRFETTAESDLDNRLEHFLNFATPIADATMRGLLNAYADRIIQADTDGPAEVGCIIVDMIIDTMKAYEAREGRAPRVLRITDAMADLVWGSLVKHRGYHPSKKAEWLERPVIMGMLAQYGPNFKVE